MTGSYRFFPITLMLVGAVVSERTSACAVSIEGWLSWMAEETAFAPAVPSGCR
jgi:hypothetical protein